MQKIIIPENDWFYSNSGPFNSSTHLIYLLYDNITCIYAVTLNDKVMCDNSAKIIYMWNIHWILDFQKHHAKNIIIGIKMIAI